LTVQIAELSARLHALTHPPGPALDRATVLANVRSRQEGRALDSALQAELLRETPGSARHSQLLDEIVALAAADAGEQPLRDGDAVDWDHYDAALEHRGARGAASDRLKLTARVAGWEPAETLQAAAALEDLRAVADPSTLPELVVSTSEANAFERAWSRLPETEQARLRARGARRSRAFADALVSIGRRIGGA
jgi:hypothetical protein